MSKTVPFQTIQFSISMQFKCKYTVYLSKTFLWQAIQFSPTVLIQIIQFSISMQLTHRYGPIRGYHSRPEWTWEQWQWRSAPHSPKHHWSLAIRSFSVIPGHSLDGVFPFCRGAISVFYCPSRLGNFMSYVMPKPP